MAAGRSLICSAGKSGLLEAHPLVLSSCPQPTPSPPRRPLLGPPLFTEDSWTPLHPSFAILFPHPLGHTHCAFSHSIDSSTPPCNSVSPVLLLPSRVLSQLGLRSALGQTQAGPQPAFVCPCVVSLSISPSTVHQPLSTVHCPSSNVHWSQNSAACSEELQQAQQLGCLDHLLVGYSREPGQPKQYVQDTIKSNSKLLKELLVHGDSHIYVCGDSNMAHAVSASFAAVIGNHLSRPFSLSDYTSARLLIHTFVHSISRSFICLVVHSFVHVFIHACSHLSIHLCIHSCTHVSIHQCIHSLVHALI